MNKHIILIIICSILILSSTAAAQTLQVSTDRYSLFAPWTNKASAGSLSSDFKAYALLLDNNGTPISGANITFEIRSAAGVLKATKYNFTQSNGLASVSYDTINDFTASGDTDYGTWTVKAYRTGSPTITESTNMSIGAGGSVSGSCGSRANCHETVTIDTGGYPRSPYTDGYGSANTRVEAAHTTNAHTSRECFACHPGYATTKTGLYGQTGDVHKSRTCDYCHGNWTYISVTGLGIPRMPSCTQCHPVYNNNVKNINTLAILAAGSGISVYSFNFDTKTPLVAHNSSSGVNYSLTKSVPCIACHGPAHNNSKPSMSASNSTTENEQCYTCHTTRATTHKSNTNCISCHSQDAHNVSIAGGGPDCISCHDTGGSATHRVDANAINSSVHSNLNSGAAATVNPLNKKCWGCHQSDGSQPTDMGDRYTNPYKCYDCHNGSRVDPYSGLIVTEHFKDGQDIKAAKNETDNSSSCLPCHNVSEMKVSYLEPDALNTRFSLASHYGRYRNDLIIGGKTVNCTYCHLNGSTAFSSAMTNPENKNVKGHSYTINLLFFSINITCNLCHGSGRMHNYSLSKPTSSNDTYCKTCHTTKSEHKTLYCTECHTNNTNGAIAGREIHDIKYLLKNNTFSTSNTSSADCTTCHQSNVVDGSLGTFTPEKIGELHHSNNLTNGSRWDNYWTSTIGACLYCHNDTKHSTAPLGRPLTWNASYVMRTTVGSGTNCADCHYKEDTNYASMSSTFTGVGLKIPPGITNGSWNSKPGYFNHSSGDYTDTTCKGCHYKGTGTTVGQVLHNVSEGTGGGGGGCLDCHTLQQGIYPGVNTTVFTKHKNVNTSDGLNNLTDSDCITCHYDTTDMSNVLTKTCNDCHTGSSGPIIENHRPVNGVVVNITTGSCSTCHNNSIAKYSYSPNASTSHYATKTSLVSTKDCLYCHKNSVNGNNWGGATDPWNSPTFPHSLTTTTKEECYSCHGDISAGITSFHNKTLKKSPLSSVSCLDCHKLGTNMSLTKIDSGVSSAAVHKNKNCPDCHTGATTGNMDAYSVMANPPVACTNCHAGLEHQPSAPDVQTTIYCKDCHNNNGMYTTNVGTNGTEDAVAHYLKDVTNMSTTPYGHTGPIDTSNCMNCHGPSGMYTGDPNWGSPVDISTSPKRIHAETTIAECNNCHKDNTISTLANVDFHNSALTGGAGGTNCVSCHAGVE